MFLQINFHKHSYLYYLKNQGYLKKETKSNQPNNISKDQYYLLFSANAFMPNVDFICMYNYIFFGKLHVNII